MNRVIQVLCLSLLLCNSIPAQEKTTSAPKPKNVEAAGEPRESANSAAAKLPVRRVVLYKNGVGYFEHLGSVRGSQDVHVDFTSAQLNDVLKSLTVLDLSGGKISGVDYNSEAPLARRLYAASRSVALPLAAVYAMALRSRGGVAALAVAMILVQLFDAMIGFRLNDPGRAYGPMAFSAINFGLLLWMNRAATTRD